MPKVSIIVPCWGVEKYLNRCVYSLVNQTLRDIEIVLVDDESPDNVPQMCDNWANKDCRIKVVHKKNEGLGFARNSGLEIAIGEYIAFVDSDDYVELDMYEKLYEEAKEDDADVIYSNFYIENLKGGWDIRKEVYMKRMWDGDEVKSFMLDMVANSPDIKHERQFQMSVWHSLYKRTIIEENDKIRFYSEREVNSEDFPFQIEFLKRCRKVVFIPNAFYRYCLNGSSLTQSFNVDKFRRIENLYKLMSEQLSDINEAQMRLYRFYIGYERARIHELISSGVKDKGNILKKELNRNIWKTISERYPIHCMSIYPKIFFKLMCSKNVCLLIAFCKIVEYTKRIKGIR